MGITPAHAGKSDSHTEQLTSAKDHPRTCGEKSQPRFQSKSLKGSPPHMRGKVDDKIILQKEDRITPAHAGKSNW